MRKKLRGIDLFCGAGGSSYGARNAGIEMLAGFDMWSPAQIAYKANFPKAKIYKDDIRKINAKTIKREIGEIDLIIASPECTSHSVAKGNGPRSESSKLTAFEVIRFAKIFKPKWIVIENVTSMKSWSEHPRLLEELWSNNYFVKETKLNSKYFQVPQSRHRLFLLCSLEKKATAPSYNKLKPLEPASNIIDWSSDYAFSFLRKEGRAESTLERAERAISHVGSKESFLLVYYGSDKGGGWQTLDRPLRTITTLDRFALVKPSPKGHIMRMLQPDELKIGMGFEEDYNLDIPLTRREKIKLMGNGVCPPVMESIINNLCYSSYIK